MLPAGQTAGMNPINLPEIARTAGDWFGVQGSVLYAVALAIALGWFCWRTRSIHPVTGWMWRVFVGKDDFQDPDLKRFLDTRQKLLKFRFVTGIPARTWDKAKDIIAWGEDNGEELGDIAACGAHFDKERCELKGKRRGLLWQMAGWLLLQVLFVVLLTALFALHRIDRAVLSMKTSGTWIAASADQVKRISGNEAVTAQDCKPDAGRVAARLSVTPDEAKAICNAFSDRKFPKFIEDNVAEQRGLAARGASFFLFLAALGLLGIRHAGAAIDMRQRLDRKNGAARAGGAEADVRVELPALQITVQAELKSAAPTPRRRSRPKAPGTLA